MDRNSGKRLAEAGVGGAVSWRRGWEPRYRAISCLRTGGLLGAAVSPGGWRAGTSARVEDRLLALACGEAASWNRGRGCHLRIAVSLGARDDVDAGLAEKVAAALAASSLPPQRLEIEVTGTPRLHATPRALHALGRLRHLGVRLTLDDIASGYSNLAYLRELPFDAIKIGRDVIAKGAAADGPCTRLEGMLSFARALGIVTLAEGVESEAQLSRLAAMGCDEFLGDPLDEAAQAPCEPRLRLIA